MVYKQVIKKGYLSFSKKNSRTCYNPKQYLFEILRKANNMNFVIEKKIYIKS